MLWRRLEIEWTVNNFQKNQTCCFHTKKNKIIGTHEISFKFPNSAKPKIARQLRTQYVESIYRLKYYTVTLKSRLRSLKVTNRTIG